MYLIYNYQAPKEGLAKLQALEKQAKASKNPEAINDLIKTALEVAQRLPSVDIAQGFGIIAGMRGRVESIVTKSQSPKIGEVRGISNKSATGHQLDNCWAIQVLQNIQNTTRLKSQILKSDKRPKLKEILKQYEQGKPIDSQAIRLAFKELDPAIQERGQCDPGEVFSKLCSIFGQPELISGPFSILNLGLPEGTSKTPSKTTGLLELISTQLGKQKFPRVPNTLILDVQRTGFDVSKGRMTRDDRPIEALEKMTLDSSMVRGDESDLEPTLHLTGAILHVRGNEASSGHEISILNTKNGWRVTDDDKVFEWNGKTWINSDTREKIDYLVAVTHGLASKTWLEKTLGNGFKIFNGGVLESRFLEEKNTIATPQELLSQGRQFIYEKSNKGIEEKKHKHIGDRQRSAKQPVRLASGFVSSAQDTSQDVVIAPRKTAPSCTQKAIDIGLNFGSYVLKKAWSVVPYGFKAFIMPKQKQG